MKTQPGPFDEWTPKQPVMLDWYDWLGGIAFVAGIGLAIYALIS